MVAVVVAEVDSLAAGEVDDLPARRVELVDGDVDLEEQRHGLQLDVATPRLVLLHVAQILQYTSPTAHTPWHVISQTSSPTTSQVTIDVGERTLSNGTSSARVEEEEEGNV